MKDKRYGTVKNLLAGGYIQSFHEIFDVIPRSIVQQDLGLNHKHFEKRLQYVDLFQLREIYRMATLIGVDEKIMLDLVHNQYKLDRARRRII